MENRRFSLLLAIITVVLLLLAILAESVYFSNFEYRVRTRRFNKILAKKITVTESCLASLNNILSKGEDIGNASKSDLFGTMENEGITLLEYVGDKLWYWSDNSFDIPDLYDDSLYVDPLVFIHNGWFITRRLQSGNEHIIALLRIRNDYGFENDIVRNGFISEFKVPAGTEISFNKGDSEFNITDSNGKWLFSLVYPSVRKPSWFTVGPLTLWILTFIFIILVVSELVRKLAERGKEYLAILIALFVFSAIYLLVLKRKPAVYFETELFTGYRFSLNQFIPSLGHLFVLSILLAVLFWFYFNYLPLKMPSGKNPFLAWLVLTLMLGVEIVLLSVCQKIFKDVILDSSINFEPYRVLDLSVYSLIGFLSLILLMLVPVLHLLKIFSAGRYLGPGVVFLSFCSSLIVYVMERFPEFNDFWPLLVLYILLVISVRMAFRRNVGRFSLTVLFSLIFGLYSLYYILILSQAKEIENKKVLAVSYSTEHDPEAEHLLLDLWSRLSADPVLNDMLSKEITTQEEIDNITLYLHETYFVGYWGNFNLSVVTCRNDSPLWIASDETMVDNCFDFFEDRLKKYGHQLTGTGFYFLDNQGGRSYYMGQLFYDLGDKMKNGLFIELYSDVDAFQPGYSELLLDKKYQGYVKLKDYSFAKYINGKLVLRTGDFPFDKTDAEYIDKEHDYRVFNREGYNHILYKNGNVTVMISEQRMSVADFIISFAYIFAFIFLVSNLLVILIRRPEMKSLLFFNFRQKLQISFIGIILFSFITVGILVAFFSVRQYQSRNRDSIKEKINSIYIELENRLSMETYLSPEWGDSSDPSLNELLLRLSNVFNTDINLYDTKGYLMATSRPEVFYRNLTSRRLNMVAFINLENLTKSEYIQNEKIASLEYVSAYVPFYNSSNQLLAYLNLPYFRMQSVLAREISNVIVAVVNFIVLLIIITTTLAVAIGRGLTAPLRMLSGGLASVELGKKSEHLSYKGQDEISEMVRQYNRMVDELQESAGKLANSEREFAWREMAKQIAHEIKNPLTPMKLNVQQLLKSWKDSVPGFEKKLEKFTKNQIEYIDTLSSIASAFSSFAKMPVANPVDINLMDQIKTTLELFKNAENISFRVSFPHDQQVIVSADKEHLNGIFSNLIKNAIQSIPQGQEGSIKINMELQGDRVLVSIEDNGSGIPEELKKNMFTPNFTTKSSGTGLGLSIVKRYVETANGRVWFESTQGSGSVFFVELPIKFTVERL
jgi:two-component system nitrogen regulation sensor histidine kinase NtrY